MGPDALNRRARAHGRLLARGDIPPFLSLHSHLSDHNRTIEHPQTGEQVWQNIHDNTYISDLSWRKDGKLIAFTKESSDVAIVNVEKLGVQRMLPPVDVPLPGAKSLAPWQLAVARAGT